MDEISQEEKLAWRQKIRAVDANLQTVLKDVAGQEKASRPLLSRKKGNAASKPTDETPGPVKRGLRFSLPHAAG